MSDDYQKSDVWINLKKSFDANKLSHAYIIEVDNICLGEKVALGITSLVLDHPEKNIDCLCIRPKSKSNSILSEDIEELISFLNKTSFSGNWKCCIIFQAEKVNINAQNKLLKILEEPPKKTLLLLTTINTSTVLPTIISRCKRLRFKSQDSDLMQEIGSLFKNLPPKNGMEAISIAEKFYNDYMNNLKILSYQNNNVRDSSDESSADEETRIKNLQKVVIKNLIYWLRDLLVIKESSKNIMFTNYSSELHKQSKSLEKDYILRAIDVFEKLLVKIDLNISDKYLVQDAFRKIIIY